ncbi:MAG: CAP domain-containing protein [Anaerolineaceae bacterium]|nr:CAP domain-containing protein [Anaerolineaceae bacterium]
MKKIAVPFIIVLITSLLTSNLLAMQTGITRGTIRGTVYLDVNGDGRCGSSAGELPVPNIDLTFVTLANDQRATLFTGSNGTYGLPSAGQGTWVVTAVPNPSLWRVTSTNPVQVKVSEQDGWVKLHVDFCVQAAPGVSVSTARLQTLPRSDAASVLQSIPVPSPNTGMSNSEISEQLLTNPPAPQPAPNLEATAATEVTAVPAESWLTYLNHFRTMGGLTPLQNSPALSNGTQLHSRYMVLNDAPIAHSQSSSNPLYTPEGDQAAKNGNIFATTQIQADHTWAINFWISAPFHLTPIIDPGLETVGYGNFNAPNGTFRMAAVLDVQSEQGVGSGATFPLYFPGNGSTTWVVRHSLFEWPDPLASCSGYKRPAGAPIVLQLGDGSTTPRVTSHSLAVDGRVVESCLFTESSYSNPDSYAQATGRKILDERDAIVIMPRSPLLANSTYTATVVANGQTYTWSFTTGSPPPTE